MTEAANRGKKERRCRSWGLEISPMDRAACYPTMASTFPHQPRPLFPPSVSLPARLARRAFASVALLVSAAACGGDTTTAPSQPSDPATETFAASLGVNISQMTRKSADLYVQDLVVGNGTEATTGRIIRVTYTGWLTNGTKFDSNAGGSTFAFQLGNHDVISGWDQGLVGMRVGGKRRLVIGSNSAYGASGRGTIPPNATLVFDVELVSIV